jgi:formylglycine-generating enzyme required for sulfatase activity
MPLSHRSSLPAALVLALGALGCERPAGYVLVHLDTDVPVPELIDRMRIDVFAMDGRWLDSTDRAVGLPTSDPDSGRGAALLPIGFALHPQDLATRALLRVRAYREGHVRAYPPVVAPRMPVARSPAPRGCRNGPWIAAGEPVVIAAVAQPAPPAGPSCEGATAATELGVAIVEVPRLGRYRLVLDDLSPGERWRQYLAPVVFLLSGCEASAPVLACGADRTAPQPMRFTSLSVDLARGRYAVLIGNQRPATLEARILLQSLDDPGSSPPAAPLITDQAGEPPRLLIGGSDVTPRQEPEPGLAIDRLAQIAIDPEADRRVNLRLSGDCFGVTADLERRQSCLGSSGLLEKLGDEPSERLSGSGTASRAGAWSPGRVQGCSGPPPPASEQPVCVPGGVFTLGDTTVLATGADAATPERIAAISPFYMDRTEFTVGRYRRLRQQGAALGDEPDNNLAPLDFAVGGVDGDYCTYNEGTAGGARYPERERDPLTCVSAESSAKICAAVGGRLPTAAEWEFAAAAAGRAPGRTRYPWGDGAPACAQAVFARWGDSNRGHDECAPAFGPAPVDDVRADHNLLGITGLGGNVSEWTSDSHRGYSEGCWTGEPLANPSCREASPPLQTVKGGSWRQDAAFARAAVRWGAPPNAMDDAIGFRCVYDIAGSKPR